MLGFNCEKIQKGCNQTAQEAGRQAQTHILSREVEAAGGKVILMQNRKEANATQPGLSYSTNTKRKVVLVHEKRNMTQQPFPIFLRTKKNATKVYAY